VTPPAGSADSTTTGSALTMTTLSTRGSGARIRGPA
jgi:hypothetical protein